jgi:nucleoside-diphosphate-sugar epimerase
MTKKILITAANGMGPYIIKAFQTAGYEVFAIARNEERKQTALARNDLPADHILTCDFAFGAALTSKFWKKLITDYKIDGVVNNAMVSPKNTITKPEDRNQTRTYRVNAEMPAALFEACAESGIPVIQQSTSKAHILNDKNDAYRISKNLARISLQRLVAKKDLKGVVVEAGMMVVPGDGHYRMELLATMPFNMKLLQKPGIMQPLDMGDMTGAMAGMMKNLQENRSDLITPGTVYQAAGPQPLTLEQYTDGIRQAMGIAQRRRIPVPMPSRMAQRFMHVATITPFSGLSPVNYVDMQELRRDFSVEPKAVAAFMKAGNLTTLRSPYDAYKRYALKHGNSSSLGTPFALAGFDIERWLKSVLHEKWNGNSPPTAAAPLIDASCNEEPQPSRKRVLVTGATGFIGPLIVQELLAAGYEVVCAIRSPEKAKRDLPYPGIEFIKADMNKDTNPKQWLERLKEYRIDTVINNAGVEQDTPQQKMDNINIRAPIALAQACQTLTKESGAAKRFIEISTGFLTAKNYKAFPYPRSKKAVEDALSRMDGLDWVVVRPNYVYEPGRGHILFEELVKLPVLLFVNDGAKQPISNRDLALGLAKLATPGDSASHCILEAAGAETLGWRDMLLHVNEAVHEHLQYTPRIPRIAALSMTAFNQALPRVALKAAAPFIKVDASILGHMVPQTFRMLCSGTKSDSRDWIKYTGITPSSISEVYRAWHESPAAYAALYDRKREQNPKLTAATPSPQATGSARRMSSAP